VNPKLEVLFRSCAGKKSRRVTKIMFMWRVLWTVGGRNK
jgi:hypothetical protein